MLDRSHGVYLHAAGQVKVHHVLVRGRERGQGHGRGVERGGRGPQRPQPRPEHREAGPHLGGARTQLVVHIREEVWTVRKLDSWHHFVFQNTFQFEKRQ